jgi:hypothetical protein
MMFQQFLILPALVLLLATPNEGNIEHFFYYLFNYLFGLNCFNLINPNRQVEKEFYR